MNMSELFSMLNRQGIKLQIDGNDLTINAPKSKLTPDLLKELREKKKEIISFLQDYVQAKEKFVSIEPTEEKEYYLLSSAQKRLYILYQMNVDSTAYNIAEIISLPTTSDKKEIEETFKKLIKRHENLRTSFYIVNDIPVQRIHESVEFYLDLHNSKDSQDSRNFLKRFIKPFDLAKTPLIRAGLIKEESGKVILIVDMSHIISDGVSHEVLVKDFLSLYEGEDLLPLRIQYKDFSEWQRGEKEKENIKRQEGYWLMEFGGEIPVLELPTDYPRPLEQSFEGNSVYFEIKEEETLALKAMAVSEGSTLFMVLLGIYNILLSKLCGQEDIVIGTPIAGRRHADLEKIIGVFVNTLSLRNYPAGDRTFRDFVGEVKARTLMAFENQDYPFEELVDKLFVKRDVGRNPIFDVLFVMQNMNTGLAGQDKKTEVENSRSVQADSLKEYKNIFQAAKFDLTLIAIERGAGLFLLFSYCIKLFKKETVEQFMVYFKKIVSIVIKKPGIRLCEIEIISEEEKNRILFDFNKTEREYPKDKTIHRLFEEQVERTPDHIAVVDRSTQTTYYALNEKSNRFAQVLQQRGMKANGIVGITVRRSGKAIVGILSILKSGGAYLPIDSNYPWERKMRMLRDSRARFVIVDDRIEVGEISHIEVIDIADGELIGGEVKNPGIDHKPDDLIYTIFTSGSTGAPKGAGVYHRGFMNLMSWYMKEFDVNREDRVLLLTSLSFDLTQKNIYAPLSVGGVLCITADEYFDPHRVRNEINKNKLTWINCTPGMFYKLLEEEEGLSALSSLRYVFLGGEPIKIDMLKRWYESGECKGEIVNTYGPTECTDVCAYYRIKDWERYHSGNVVPIGIPVYNTRLYILDRFLRMTPVGAAGELCISGKGVGAGYINHPEMTVEKFTHMRGGSFSGQAYLSPTLTQNTITLYKTGDLSRWLPNGNIEYLGRIDYQVKIRGFRIELGEIESRLSKVNGIKEAVALAREEEGGDKYICAYFVSDSGLVISELREILLKELPDYMIPSYFVRIEKIPLTSNGKIDRRALPNPKEKSLKEDLSYILPLSAIEKKLVEIWEKVLGRDKIGINENFFAIGGDSIKSIQIISRMIRAGYKVEMKDIFQYPVILDLARRVKKIKRIPDQSIIIGIIPLTPIQRDFFNQAQVYSHHYNQAVMLYSREGFDKRALRAVFSKILEHHDALRLTFKKNPLNEEIVQFNHEVDLRFLMDEFDLKNIENNIEELNVKVNQVQASIDLENGPLMKLALFHLNDGNRLLIVVHHLVIDGVSWRIIFEDIETLYGQYKRGKKLVLPLKTDSYKLWAEQLTQYANSKNFLKEKSYWQKIESAEVPSIPGDFPIAESFKKDITGISFTLNEEETERLLTKANYAFGTEIIDLLLTAFGMAMKKTFDHDRVSIILEGHGREQILEDIDISRTVGWFTSLYPILMDISFPENLDRQVKEIKEILRSIPNKGIGYGILKYLTDESNKKEIEFKLKPQILFNYLGQFDADINQKSFFEIAEESTGNSQSLNNKREYLIDVSGMTIKKCLTMSILFNKTHFKRETMIELIRKFEFELNHLIAFCCSKENIELTPSDFTYKELPIETVDLLMKVYPGINDIYTLTPMQQGILFHSLVDGSSFSYFEQMSYRLHGNLNISIIEKSLNDLFKRHDILRTVFVSNGIDRPVQIVLRERTVDFYYEDISHIEKIEEKEVFISEFKQKDKIRSFDLSKDVLMRVAILRIDNLVYEFTWSFHHILMDGWCIGILNREFFEIYRSYIENRTNRLPGVKPYRAYIQWLERRDNEESVRYWENYLDSFEEQTSVPRTKISKDGSKYRNEIISVVLDMDKTAALKKLATKNQVTLNTLTQTVWGILLGKYNEKEDVIFGAVVSGRPSELEGVETMVGLFINTIPVRIRVEGRMKFNRLLPSVQKVSLESEPYHYQPLAEIQSRSALKQNLIDHIFIFENFPIAEQIKGAGRENNKSNEILSLELANVEIFEQSNYDFNIVLSGSDRLKILFQFNESVYDRDFIEGISKHFTFIVDQVIENQELEINDLKLLSEEEKNRILYEFNDTQVEYPRDKTIHLLFEEQVERSPDYIALIGSSIRAINELYPGISASSLQISYRELDKKTDVLGRALQSKGIGPDTIVGIMMERSVEMIVGILGILKAGGAYLPIDPEYPKDRVDYIMKDSRAEILITESLLEDCFVNSLYFSDLIPIFKTFNPNCSMAYVIYTSGSTGKPKGVIVQHQNVICLVKNSGFIRNSTQDRLLPTGSVAFDISTFEVWFPLLNCMMLMLVSKEVILNAEMLKNVLGKYDISILHLVPQLFEQLSELNIELFAGLRYFLVGGDLVKPRGVNRLRSAYPSIKIVHCYGPTENTTFSTTFQVDKDYDIRIPIGKPISNSSAYIVDKYNHLMPLGVPGELCVGGDGIARGYLNLPELTAERFIENSYKPGERLYKSGDLAKLLLGDIQYIGRIDHQVKIRGFRVELGEIENQLMKHIDIKEAVVIAGSYENGNRYLCAYISANRDFLISELRRYLVGRLPQYMIPSEFVLLEKIPLNHNGKVDREKLIMSGKKLSTGVEHVAPKSDNEIIIADSWKEVLKLDKVGINDNFFDLGGTSLDIIHLNSKLKEIFKRDIPIVDMYRYTTIDSFSHFLGDGNTDVENSPTISRYKERADKIKKSIEDKNKRREIRTEIRSRRRK